MGAASSHMIASAFTDLDKSMPNVLDGTKIEEIKQTIRDFAIASSVSSVLSGVLPGAGAVVAGVAQAGFVWATYVKINKHLGISMKENTAKFIGSAVVTNLVSNGGILLLSHAGAAILSFIPIVGSVGSMALEGAVGYIIIYVSAIVYMKLITKMVKPDGTIDVTESDETKEQISQIIKDSDIEGMVKEGRSSYKEAKADGSIDEAKKHPRCPNCHVEVTTDQCFCSKCGTQLKALESN